MLSLSSDIIKSTWAFQNISEVLNNYDITAQNAIATGSDAKTSTVAPFLRGNASSDRETLSTKRQNIH